MNGALPSLMFEKRHEILHVIVRRVGGIEKLNRHASHSRNEVLPGHHIAP